MTPKEECRILARCAGLVADAVYEISLEGRGFSDITVEQLSKRLYQKMLAKCNYYTREGMR